MRRPQSAEGNPAVKTDQLSEICLALPDGQLFFFFILKQASL
jgi:hypothetical protein